MRKPKLLLVSAMIGMVMGTILPPLPASAGTYNFYMWMQPPANPTDGSSSSDKACLTNLWHSSSLEGNSKGMDWNNDCTGVSGENAYFRVRAAAPEQCCAGSTSIQSQGEPITSSPSCGAGIVHWVRVRIRDVNTAVVKGYMSYQHIALSTTETMRVQFQNAGSFSNAYFNSWKIGDMVKDYQPTCWTGYHVHENNTGTSSAWIHNTSRYNSSSDKCECHEVDHRDTWVRRLHFTFVF